MALSRDSLSAEAREKYVDMNLVSGKILYLPCEFAKPPKSKFLVLICWNNQPLVLVINSEISSFVANRDYLERCQVLLRASEYDCLYHDSYLDCSTVVTVVTMSEVRDLCLQDVSRIRGEINQATRDELVQKIVLPNNVRKDHQYAIRAALSNE